MFTLIVTVLLRTSFSRPPSWSNIAPILAVTSSSWVAHLAIPTGAAAPSGAPCSSRAADAVDIAAIHSLRVMPILWLQSDGGTDADAVHVHPPAFLGLVHFQCFVRAPGRDQRGALVLAQIVHGDVLHRVVRIIHQVHDGGLAAGRGQK